MGFGIGFTDAFVIESLTMAIFRRFHNAGIAGSPGSCLYDNRVGTFGIPPSTRKMTRRVASYENERHSLWCTGAVRMARF
jgi:hypothetical protein